ncbi:hypothetical protein FACHB389_08880 [Nostoc calcicola FACHB-389]|nr:hypothetical protein FACHB389_08880 [Nostoc calcicola FACHB-389]
MKHREWGWGDGEQGAGSREQGAGSREQGRKSSALPSAPLLLPMPQIKKSGLFIYDTLLFLVA